MPEHKHKLDNAVWWSLATRYRPLTRSMESAYMIGEDYGPFAALSGDSLTEIGGFLTLVSERRSPAYTMQRDNPFGEAVPPTTLGVQMVAETVVAPTEDPAIVDLGEEDAPQMFELARVTKPGPFERRTHELGDFIGIKKNGRLIAMAGQRLTFPGYTEISAVCVDEAFRSRGYGAALVQHMAARIAAKGDQPFLHTFASNHGAIALYTRLGFRLRTQVQITCWDDQKIAQAWRSLRIPMKAA